MRDRRGAAAEGRCRACEPSAQVSLHRLLGDEQRLGELSVRAAGRSELDLPPLARRQRVRPEADGAPGPDDRFANHAGLTFDLSVLDLYVAFATGASVHLVPTELKTVVTAASGRTIEELDGRPAVLRMNELVRYRRDGKHNFYHVNSALVCNLLESFFADSGNGPKQIQFDECCVIFKRK